MLASRRTGSGSEEGFPKEKQTCAALVIIYLVHSLDILTQPVLSA